MHQGQFRGTSVARFPTVARGDGRSLCPPGIVMPSATLIAPVGLQDRATDILEHLDIRNRFLIRQDQIVGLSGRQPRVDFVGIGVSPCSDSLEVLCSKA